MRAAIIGLLTLYSSACGGPPKEAHPETTASPAPSAADSVRNGPAALVGTVWKLVELRGKPAATGQDGNPARLELTEEGKRVAGFAGCNRMAGTYVLQRDSLRFSPLALTRMACQTGMDLEQSFIDMLGATRTYAVSPTSLLLEGEGGTLARFEAQ